MWVVHRIYSNGYPRAVVRLVTWKKAPRCLAKPGLSCPEMQDDVKDDRRTKIHELHLCCVHLNMGETPVDIITFSIKVDHFKGKN